MLPIGGSETSPPLPPPSRKVRKDIEQGSKVTGTYYSGKQGHTMSHKGVGYKWDFSDKEKNCPTAL